MEGNDCCCLRETSSSCDASGMLHKISSRFLSHLSPLCSLQLSLSCSLYRGFSFSLPSSSFSSSLYTQAEVSKVFAYVQDDPRMEREREKSPSHFPFPSLALKKSSSGDKSNSEERERKGDRRTLVLQNCLPECELKERRKEGPDAVQDSGRQILQEWPLPSLQ